MKRKIVTLLALLLIATLVLSACQSGAKGPTGPEAPAETAVPTEPEKEEPAEVVATEVVPTATIIPTATTIPAVEGDVPTGYYNLADFMEQTNKTFDGYGEAPMLAERVSGGDLPPVEERLPDNPLVYRTFDKVGTYGGTLRFNSINIDQDWHLRHINSANLIEMPASASWDAVSTVYGAPQQPGIFESFGMNEEGTEFTATIRKGLKWSDGVPVTTKDVAFRFNDVLLNKDLNPTPMPWLLWGGGNTVLTIVDDYTFKYTFAGPYGSFIEAEVTMWPATFYKHMYPAHYLQQYHKDYVEEAELLEIMKAENYNTLDEWAEFFGTKTALFGVDNTFLDNGKIFPTLNPYIIIEDQGNGNYLLERNPYFYMVDQDGNQLPYIDKLQRTYLADSEQEDLSIIAGNTDLSCMSISIDSYPLYKEHEVDGNYVAMPLPAWQDQIYIVGFNEWAGIKPPVLESVGMTTIDNPVDEFSYDPGLSVVYSDVRFRRAMSLALDRETMNEALFLGLGRPAQVAPRPGTPFYEEGMEESYAQYDPEGAKALLEEMGMVDSDGDGWRERPDGQPFTMKFDFFVITGASIPGTELVKRYWEDVGIKVEVKQSDVGYWWGTLMTNNINEATTWWLAGSGANLLQDWFLGPSMLVPLWGRYTTYKDQVSDKDWETILQYVPEWQREMQDLRKAIKVEPDPEKRIEIGKRIWQLQAEWLPIIGVATDTRSPLVISADIGNVEMSEELKYNFITVMEASEGFFFKNPARLTP